MGLYRDWFSEDVFQLYGLSAGSKAIFQKIAKRKTINAFLSLANWIGRGYFLSKNNILLDIS